MIERVCILLTWYLTKYYYTRSWTVKVSNSLEEHGLVQAKCSKCARVEIIKTDNLRTPSYCSVCK